MTDIVERLHSTEYDDLDVCKAADEIETLRKRVKELESMRGAKDIMLEACGDNYRKIREELAALAGYKDAWVEAQRGRSVAERELAALKGQQGNTLSRFHEAGADTEPDPVERLRFFCSLAMTGQDWLDVEPFFDALPNEKTELHQEVNIIMDAVRAYGDTRTNYEILLMVKGLLTPKEKTE